MFDITAQKSEFSHRIRSISKLKSNRKLDFIDSQSAQANVMNSVNEFIVAFKVYSCLLIYRSRMYSFMSRVVNEKGLCAYICT